jgi:hypothetical protein
MVPRTTFSLAAVFLLTAVVAVLAAPMQAVLLRPDWLDIMEV